MNRHITQAALGLTLLAAGAAGADPVTTVVPRVVAGNSSSALLQANGNVQTWGENAAGVLGLGDTTMRSSPSPVSNLSGIVGLAIGQYHMLAVGADGTVSAWGQNWEGQLGLGDGDQRNSPVLIPGFTDVRSVAAGPDQGFAIKNDGTLWAWGMNWGGELGLGDTNRRDVPNRVTALEQVTAVACNGFGFDMGSSTFAVAQDGKLWAWGSNWNGQLGLGDGGHFQYETPQPVTALSDVMDVKAGRAFVLALTRSGNVYAWGDNGYGQLGLGDTQSRSTPTQIPDLTDIIGITTGGYHAFALRRDGRVLAWGYNWDGRLGLGEIGTDRSTPTLIPAMTEVVAISAGQNHVLAMKADGSVWAWGNNWYGTLGLGDSGNGTNRSTPTQIAAGEHVASTLTPAIVDFVTIERGVDLTPESATFEVATGSMNLDFANTAAGGATGFFTGYTPGTCVSGPMSDASGSCQFDLGGKITGATGLRVGRLAIPADGTLAKAVVLTATANVTGGWLQASPARVDFGPQPLNTPADRTVTFANRGTADVTISQMQTTGAGFSVAEEGCTAAGGVLNPGATCTVSVRYTATRGARSVGRLTFTGDSPVPVALALTGSGDAPRLIRSRSRFAFGTVPKGTTSNPQTLTLRNGGAQALSIARFTVPAGRFGILSNTCGATLEPGANCAITLRYAPLRRGLHRARAMLVTDDPNQPTLYFPLTGTGG